MANRWAHKVVKVMSANDDATFSKVKLVELKRLYPDKTLYELEEDVFYESNTPLFEFKMAELEKIYEGVYFFQKREEDFEEKVAALSEVFEVREEDVTDSDENTLDLFELQHDGMYYLEGSESSQLIQEFDLAEKKKKL